MVLIEPLSTYHIGNSKRRMARLVRFNKVKTASFANAEKKWSFFGKLRTGIKLDPKFFLNLGWNLPRTLPEKPGPTYNSDLMIFGSTKDHFQCLLCWMNRAWEMIYCRFCFDENNWYCFSFAFKRIIVTILSTKQYQQRKSPQKFQNQIKRIGPQYLV